MIITRLKGGLGNQLFQYALGRRLAIIHDTALLLDISALDTAEQIGNIYRPFSLQKFTIAATVATPADIAPLIPHPSLPTRLWQKLQNRLWGDKTVHFDPRVLARGDNQYLDGYWQSPRYFEAIRSELLTELTLKDPLCPAGATLATQMQNTPSVSLHVRRGDYLSNPRVRAGFGVCSLPYYEAAIAKLRALVPGATFFIFSDDLAWVKEQLPVGDSAVFVEGDGLDDAQELWLMSQCQHNIIANSSFSWWGAWLNDNPDKIVVAPTPWFDKEPYDKDLLPTAWILLPK